MTARNRCAAARPRAVAQCDQSLPQRFVARFSRRQPVEQRRDVEAAAAADDRQLPAPNDVFDGDPGLAAPSVPPNTAPRARRRRSGGTAPPRGAPRKASRSRCRTRGRRRTRRPTRSRPPRRRATSCASSVFPGAGLAEQNEQDRPGVAAHGPSSPRHARRVAAGSRSTRTSDRSSVRTTGTQNRASVASVSGAGWPKRLRRPQESRATRGAGRGHEAPRSSRSRLPWWPTLSTSTARQRPGREQLGLGRRAGVAGQQRGPAVALEQGHDRLVVDRVGLARAGRPSAGRRGARRRARQTSPASSTRTGTPRRRGGRRRAGRRDLLRPSPAERQSAPTGSSSRTAKSPSAWSGCGCVSITASRRVTPRSSSFGSSRVRPKSAASRSNGPPPSTSIARRFQRRSIASPCPTSSASIENPRRGPAGAGAQARAARNTSAARRRGRAGAPAPARAPAASEQQPDEGHRPERRRRPQKRARPRPAPPATRAARLPRPKSAPSGPGGMPDRVEARAAPPRARSGRPTSGIESGAVSHAPAATTLNLQKRTGAVAHCAASADRETRRRATPAARAAAPGSAP